MSDNRLQELLDKEDIRTVLGHYCRAIDRLDAALLETVYHPDAWEHHGAFEGEASTWRQQALVEIPQQVERMRHLLGTMNIDLDHDVAHVETYFSAGCVLRESQDGQKMLRLVDGRYLDRFENRKGEWRIARRTVVMDYITVRPLPDRDEPFPLSQWGRDDLVYRPGRFLSTGPVVLPGQKASVRQR